MNSDSSIIVAVVFFIFFIWQLRKSLVVIKEGECGVVLRLGKVQAEPLARGLRLIWPWVDALYRVQVEPQTLAVAAQTLRVQGDIDVRVSATCSFRVVDAVRALAEVQDYRFALHELVKLTMRDVVGKITVDDIEYAAERVSEQVKELLEQDTRKWGLEILSFEIKSEAH